MAELVKADLSVKKMNILLFSLSRKLHFLQIIRANWKTSNRMILLQPKKTTGSCSSRPKVETIMSRELKRD